MSSGFHEGFVQVEQHAGKGDHGRISLLELGRGQECRLVGKLRFELMVEFDQSLEFLGIRWAGQYSSEPMGDLFREIGRRVFHQLGQSSAGLQIGFVVQGDEGLQWGVCTNSSNLTDLP